MSRKFSRTIYTNRTATDITPGVNENRRKNSINLQLAKHLPVTQIYGRLTCAYSAPIYSDWFICQTTSNIYMSISSSLPSLSLYIYIYIYIRERERKIERKNYVYTYMYIWIYMHIPIYIYIYIHVCVCVCVYLCYFQIYLNSYLEDVWHCAIMVSTVLPTGLI